MRIRKLLVTLSVTTLFAAGTVPGMGQEPLDPGFEALVDRYLEAIHGVGANTEPDTMSAESFAARVQVSRDLLEELEAIDRDGLAFVQDIDWRFLRSRLEARIIEGERVQRWRQDPKLYLNNRDVAFKILADPRPVNTRAAELVNDIELLQVRLRNAETNLDQYIARWVELANDFVDGFALVLQNELPPFAERVSDGGLRDRLLAAGKDGVAALAEYRRFINEDFPQREQGDYAIGEEVFNELMEKKYLFPVNDMHLRRIARGAPEFTRVPDYHEWGWKQFDIVMSHLEVKANRIDPERTWLEIIHDEKEDHFFAEQLVYKHLEATRATRDWVIDNDLVTIPWDDDDAIMEAADPSLWASQWWGWGPGVPVASPFRKAAWTVIPVNPGLARRHRRGQPPREGRLLHVRDRDPRGVPGAPPAASLPEHPRPSVAGLREQLFEPVLVLLHRVGTDAGPAIRLVPGGQAGRLRAGVSARQTLAHGQGDHRLRPAHRAHDIR